MMLIFIGFALVFAGIVLMMIFTLLLIARGAKAVGGRVESGGLVVVGPIPIAFGTSREIVKVLMVLGIVLVALLIVLNIIPFIMR